MLRTVLDINFLFGGLVTISKKHIVIALATTTLTVSLLTTGALAVDPGWGNNNDYSSVTNNDSNTAENNNQPPMTIYTPESPPASSGSNLRSNTDTRSGGNNSMANSSSTTPQNNQQTNRPTDDNNGGQQSAGQSLSQNSASFSSSSSSAQSSSSSSQSSSSSSSSSSIHQLSKNELMKYAKNAYKQKRVQVKAQNNQRVNDNNNKGAVELKDGYKEALKKIASGAVSKQERIDIINKQKDALQKALSKRLGNLQAQYAKDQAATSAQISSLKDDHSSDYEAMRLNSRLSELDYNLGVQSNRAYTRYNKAMAKLDDQGNVKVKAKREQRRDAKTAYVNNLAAVDAVDPDALVKQNKHRLVVLKQNYNGVKAKINAGEIDSTNDVDKVLGQGL